ncbi:unnamed protein product [Rotaria sordida]|uniref:Uncharacterized protein n=1 Tax=Rotaria sordida TaxID=392033 RepID=A0A818Q646_9BILA|nr:unnamed protein product [Rotaria sordida]CAF3632154.1 unnamed protein product [Rotaria sordida]
MNDIFPNLHSITLNKIDSNIWNLIRTRLPSFISLRSIFIYSVDDLDESTATLMSLIFHDLLFNVKSLKHLFLETLYGQNETIIISTSSLIQTSTIECLTVIGIQINLHQIFAIAPMLRQLNVKLIVTQFYEIDTIFQPSINLQQLSINNNRMTMFEIRHLLSSMTCLTYLSLDIDNVDNDMINGNVWIPLLTRIIAFQFIFKISNEMNIDLNTFRTQFWLEEKKWYVTFDQWTDTSCSFLYTNPCFNGYYYPLLFVKKTLITESTGLEPTTYPHTKYLFFDIQSPMSQAHLRRFTHAHTLIVESDFDISFKNIITCIDLSRITSFVQGKLETKQSNNEFVRILHNLPHLRSLCLHTSTLILFFNRHWPQILDLNMKIDSLRPFKRLSSNEIDALWRSFTHLKQLEFDRQSVRNLSRLFNTMTMTLSNVSIRHYGDINNLNPRMVTRQWLEQNTKLCQFDYFKDNKWEVYLWL